MIHEPLLALLQLGDSAFPSGGFTHSYGLEQVLREGRLRGPAAVEAFVRSVLASGVATADAPAAHGTAVALALPDLAAVIEVDRALWRTKAAAELRQASVQVGRRLVEEGQALSEDARLHAFAAAVAEGRAHAVQPVAFAVVATAFGVQASQVAPALLFGAANALLQAWMRLQPVSHRDVQAILTRLRPLIASLAAAAQTTAGLPLRAFHPLQEIASMRHAGAEARLFAS
jgi:urease accessory protein